MLDYPSLAAVGLVIREGSFERAADMLGITPSAVSQRVKGLEERLGAILIVRGQPCLPTDLGRTLSAHLDMVQLLEAELEPALTGNFGNSGSKVTLKVAVNADSLATWFPQAAAAFGRNTGILLDITLDDEAHTRDRLRASEVLAAVTSDPEPVQGCKTIALGALNYVACASPDFMSRYFSSGVTAEALLKAPCMRFDRRDRLQSRWASEAYGIDLAAPTHWVPSTQAFLDLALAGLAWGLQPIPLAQAHLAAGRLMELPPGLRVDVTLYWTAVRFHAASLRQLTNAVFVTARQSLQPASTVDPRGG
jgi:LysR family transcriptional regulator (chromosome initiation inhibitor)